MDEPRELTRDLRRGPHERLDLAALDPECDDAWIVPGYRTLPRKHLEKHHADGVYIGSSVDAVRTARLLWSHVLGCPHSDACHSETLLRRVRTQGLGDAEIDELEDRHPAHEGNKYVLGLQVAVDDAERMGSLERIEDLASIFAGRRDRELVLPIERGGERLALEQLHHNVRFAVGRSVDVEDLHDVRTSDLGSYARLLKESLDELRPPEHLRVQNLDGHARAEDDVLSFEDRAHPAVAERTDEPVLALDDGSYSNHARASG
jgi:hypothetical protein